MRKTKLYKALANMDRNEHRRLRKLVASPYFNRSEEIGQLLDLLLADVARSMEPGAGELEKTTLWAQLNPGKDYDDVRFRKYVSDLFKLLEEHLVQEALAKYPNLRLNLLAESVKEQKIDALVPHVHQQLVKEGELNPLRNSQYYLDRYRTEKTVHYLLDLENKRGEKANLEEWSAHLDDFYLLEKLRLLILVYSRKLLKTFDYQLDIGENLIPLLRETGKLENPSIAIYYNIYLLYAEPENEQHYFDLVELLDQHRKLFSNKEAMDELYTSAINYCLGKANQGNQQFLREYFNLISKLLDNQLLIENEELSPWHFRNTVVAGLRIGEYEWVESFINNYQKYLPESYRANALSYNYAQLYFYQKRHGNVIQQLRNVEYEDLSYNLNSKMLLIATYYETEEYEALLSLLDSFSTFLRRRSDIASNRKVLYKNYINFTKKLAKLLPGQKKALQLLREDVDALKEKTFNASWLLEKIALLEKSGSR